MTDPTPITSRLAAAGRLVQRERGGGLLLRALPWLFAALVAAFVLDVFLHLGPVARLLLIAGWVVGGLALLGAGWYVAFVCRNSAEHTARLLEDREPTLGSKLINLLQLESQITDATKPTPTRDLAKLAVTGYTEQLAAMGVKPGDVVTLIAEAVDTAPTPNFARTEPVRITVISEDDYNEFLRQCTDLSDIEAKYADLLDQLHAQTDAQKQLQKEIAALKEKLATARDPKQKEALQQEFNKLIAKQNELDRKLDKLADNMEQFVRKNPLYDIEADLQKVLAEKAEQIRSSTKQMDAKTGDIAQRSSPPTSGRQLTPEMLEEFKKTADEQLARLGATEKEGREDQLALKDLASAEKKVAEELKRVEERLREDAKGAEKLFPNAAESARELADKLEYA